MEILRSSALAAKEARKEVQTALQGINEVDLRAWVNAVSVPRNYHSQPEANAKIRSHIGELLRSFGYDVEMQGPFSNVVALPKNRSKCVTLVGAHTIQSAKRPARMIMEARWRRCSAARRASRNRFLKRRLAS
jgi:hypothetical protein